MEYIIENSWLSLLVAFVAGTGLVMYTILINKYIKKQETMNVFHVILYVLNIVLFVAFIGFIYVLMGNDLMDELSNMAIAIEAGFIDQVEALIGSVITIFVAMFVLKAINILIKKTSNKAKLNKKRIITILKITNSLIKYVVEIIALLVILSLWGVNVMPALAGLGILGIIIGMGTQSLIKDFISGFFIIIEHHFDVGDIVEINGFKGEVVDVGLKSTKVKNWKQDIKIFSNGNITDTINYTIAPSVAVIEFGIAYGENIQKVIDLLNEELPKHVEKFPDIVEAPTILGVTELADSSVNLRVIVRTHTEKHYAVERGYRQIIKETLDANGIEIPFPQVVVHSKK